MAVYAIGDVQGCIACLEKLLDKLNFDPAADTVWLTGDLVNRGPGSLETLRLVKSLGDSAVTVLGNHDLHFLAIKEGIRRNRGGDTLKGINKAADIEELAEWLRHRPLVHYDKKLRVVMVHAGIYPGWSLGKLLSYGGEIESVIRGKKYRKFLKKMYGKRPTQWDTKLSGWARRRFIVNTLTRMRYVSNSGRLNFNHNGPIGTQPQRYLPWFVHPNVRCKNSRIVFGHWSALGYFQKGNIIGLDSGCVWRGKLTAVQLDGEYIAPRTRVKCK